MSRHPLLRLPAPSVLFPALPAPVRRSLYVGSCGVLHLLETVGLGLDSLPGKESEDRNADPAHDSFFPALYADMLLAALAERPLAHDLAARLPSLPGIKDALGPEQIAELRALEQATASVPQGQRHFQHLAAQRDMQRLRSFVLGRIQAEPDQLFWREHALILAVAEGDADLADHALDADVLQTLPSVHACLSWQAAFLAGRLEQAAKLALDMEPLFGPGVAQTRLAEALLAQNRREAGIQALLQAVAASPWRSNELLRVHELLEGFDTQVRPMRGAGRIFLYTWNKAGDLDRALHALARSNLGLARIVALNNGSTDDTARVLAKWQGELGRDRMGIVELPVNIGAPAARNWLLHAEAGDADWVVYLDDDALVPQDWLGRFGSAVERLPEAGVWGCRVVDHAQPLLAQAVDYQLFPARDAAAGPDLTSMQPHPFKLSRLHIQGLDRGQFHYARTCASVTGCCHLFQRDRLEQAGDFSLFLSPSQYDDMERDIRMLASGRTAAYQGHLRVEHVKRTGRDSLLPGPENANALGNRYKMQVLHDNAEIRESARVLNQALETDLFSRLERIQTAMEEACSTEHGN